MNYRYSVAGKTYESGVLRVGGLSGPISAPGIVARYPEGAAVTVYYDPTDPQEAALER